MGQSLSQAAWLRHPPGAFMQLPIDLIILLSSSFLDPVSALALSLTCKDLWAALSVKSLSRLHQASSGMKDFLFLLEKDVWSTRPRPTFYCIGCIRLHTFDPAQDRRRHPCLNDVQSVIPISYSYARLMMNEHLYGVGRGLPLSSFDLTYHRNGWEQKWSSKVVEGRLFLSATHTLHFEGTDTGCNRFFERMEYLICAHVGVRRYSFPHLIGHVGQEELDTRGRYHHGVLMLVRGQATALPAGQAAGLPACVSYNPPWGSSRAIESFRCEDGRLKECRDVVGSCIFCATDHAPTLERAGPWKWLLTIVSYHDMGSCRSPSDPRWQASRRVVQSRYSVPVREAPDCLPGEVKRKWDECIGELEISARGLHLEKTG